MALAGAGPRGRRARGRGARLDPARPAWRRGRRADAGRGARARGARRRRERGRRVRAARRRREQAPEAPRRRRRPRARARRPRRRRTRRRPRPSPRTSRRFARSASGRGGSSRPAGRCRSTPPGSEVSALEPEIRAREERTRALSSGAREQLVVLQAEVGETREVARALALLHAFSGEKERLQRILRVARESGARDPWIELADGWGDARDPDRAARERSLVKLGALAAAQPGLVRGRFLLARAELALGRRAEALATVEGVLATNPKHEGARRMREELVAKAPAAPPAPAVAPAAPPGKPPPQQRKLLPQPRAGAFPPGRRTGPCRGEPPSRPRQPSRRPIGRLPRRRRPRPRPPSRPPRCRRRRRRPPAPARRARPSVDPTGDLGSGG